MKKLILLTFTCCTLFASNPHTSRPTTSGWSAYSLSGKYSFSTASTTELATVVFPTGLKSSGSLAFLTEPSGSISGGILTTIFSITTTGSPTFTYWGEGIPNVNPGKLPASLRLYFSTATTYNVNTATAYEDNYWWSNPNCYFLAPTGDYIISVSLAPEYWSNANGHSATTRLSGFNAAQINCKTVGFAFGGGSFFDVGVNVITGTGNATLHVKSYNKN